MFQGAREISRTHCFSVFQRFHDKTFKNPRIHKSAFQKTGLIFFNPILVLSKVKEYQALQVRPETPLVERSSSPLPSSSPAFATPPPRSDWSQFNTPLTMRTRKKGVEYIRKRHFESIEQGTPITPSVIRVAEKVEKGSETSMLRGALSKHRLYILSKAEAAHKRRKEASGKVVQKYGEIRVYQARRQIEGEEEEKRVINMRLKRLEKGWHKNYLKVLKELEERFNST